MMNVARIFTFAYYFYGTTMLGEFAKEQYRVREKRDPAKFTKCHENTTYPRVGKKLADRLNVFEEQCLHSTGTFRPRSQQMNLQSDQ
jgi:hypothetical protein